MNRPCVDCGKFFDPLVERSIKSDRCNACTAPKGLDSRAVAKSNREMQIAALDESIKDANHSVAVGKMNNDQHEVTIARNRLEKLLDTRTKLAGN